MAMLKTRALRVRLPGSFHLQRSLSTSSTQLDTQLRRSFFYVPASSPKFLSKAHTTPTDVIVYDLEDGVAPDAKPLARQQLRALLSDPPYVRRFPVCGGSKDPSPIEEAEEDADVDVDVGRGNGGQVGHRLDENAQGHHQKEICIRINAVGTGEEIRDIEAIAPYDFDSICIPKVHSPDEIHTIQSLLTSCLGPKRASQIHIIALIESARAILSLPSIAASSPNLRALIFAAEDFCADTGIRRSSSDALGGHELLYARSAVVMACKAHRLQAIDMVCTDLTDPEVLRRECEQGSAMGFTGKQLIHPSQITVANAAFSPSKEAVEHAIKILRVAKENFGKGRGAFRVDGKMVDMPVVAAAERVWGMAVRAGLVEGTEIR
ncbi:beta subunit of citrate lyase [Saitoella complicata NRRL Y-17804]|uniref:beta subunit of citrate lyase n=1 Tax=Saitoella complicata (strain BCRC 22490 / CBS 7301 / JCM 7358 / NBRC 10748 / NRRL Y-17804) TaxID=698492 RepID=UPI0008675ADB|nr:beta subunit of citrate lyase [Saitoella complicata NRRL Y-17804]ODQ53295.1 beta subunit of citrate lyase [Saitoella complicata NRRL Y-17804]